MGYPKTVNTLACLIARPLSEARARGKRTAPLGGRRGRRNRSQRGMTLLELIVASFVLLILASAALPVVRVTIVRSKEAQLHKALREIRNAIDRYKDYGDLHLIRVEVGNRSEEHTSELQSRGHLVCRLLLEKKKKIKKEKNKIKSITQIIILIVTRVTCN